MGHIEKFEYKFVDLVVAIKNIEIVGWEIRSINWICTSKIIKQWAFMGWICVRFWWESYSSEMQNLHLNW